MAMLLKLDGRTSRGRLWKDLNTCGKPMNQGIILGGKMCSNCNQAPDFDKEVIKCMKCNHPFHAKCMHLPISEESVKSFSENPSMWWFCLSCVSVKSAESSINNNQISESSSVQSDIILQTTLSTFKKDMLNLISETIDRKFNDSNCAIQDSRGNAMEKIKSPPAQGNAWSKVKHISPSLPVSEYPVLNSSHQEQTDINNSKKEKHVLLLDPSDPEVVNSVDFKKKTVHSVNKAIHGINVNFCSVKKSGVVALGFDDIESKANAEEKIKESAEITDVFSTRSPKKLLPKVTLLGINEVIFDECSNKDEMKTALLEDILLRNDDIKKALTSSPDESLEVLVIQKSMPSDHTVSYSAILKMSSNVRKAIHKRANRIYVSLSRCRVFDKYQILQCYHCQKPGHHSNNCPKKDDDPTCLYCGGNHKSKLCVDKGKKCCINCLNSSNDLHRSQANTHSAASIQCPILKPFRDNIKDKTENWFGKK